ncbi:MAG TPA: prephenate dehydrogenase/arogenate dehydrogenase family protein [Candidatus Nanoarchaeia archaeon]|nr:prephenate dehydrogenase/arogenate dehydrogenase family protein [Candidatus Nanoarchaeia archaeon]
MVISLIDEFRKDIDRLDEEILKLLSRRKELVKNIAKFKEKLDLPIFNKKREEEILKIISGKAKELGLDINSVSNVFNSIFQSSRIEQQKQMIKVECGVKKIGLIGFGRFGKLIANHLSDDFEFYVYNKSDKSKEIRQNNATQSSLREACQKDIVILSTPISEMETTLKAIKNLIKKNSIVVDVCSVKEYPVKLMKNILPKNIQILATHPMFGPDTASDSLEGRKIVLCRVRIKDEAYSQIKRFLESKLLNVIETSPQKHDEEIAKSLVLTHFIGRALIDMKASALEIDTRGYRDLIRILDTVKNDTWQLFEDMNKFNKYSKNIKKKFVRSLTNVDNRLKQ